MPVVASSLVNGKNRKEREEKEGWCGVRAAAEVPRGGRLRAIRIGPIQCARVAIETPAALWRRYA